MIHPSVTTTRKREDRPILVSADVRFWEIRGCYDCAVWGRRFCKAHSSVGFPSRFSASDSVLAATSRKSPIDRWKAVTCGNDTFFQPSPKRLLPRDLTPRVWGETDSTQKHKSLCTVSGSNVRPCRSIERNEACRALRRSKPLRHDPGDR